MARLHERDLRGTTKTGWLDSKHTFSFGGFEDPNRMGVSALRVINEDHVIPGAGFPTHGHRDMEIITYVRAGAITHQDSMGNKGRTEAGDVQVMSAGSGIQHSEWNAEDENTTIFQLWIEPAQDGGDPDWGAKAFPKADRSGEWAVLASGRGDADALPIRQDAAVLGATLKTGEHLEYEVKAGRYGYLVLAAGSVELNGEVLHARDGAAITGDAKLTLKGVEDAEIVFVDTV
jgi:redox-sensitive bicupin YhaK (pirin superfamily)